MSLWIIEPRDPVIFRDGKPFGTVPGARSKSMSFPFPSTVVGALRTHSGRDANGRFDTSRIDELLRKTMKGPLLVNLTPAGDIDTWLIPAPADALLLKDEIDTTKARRVQLRPLAMPDGVYCDLDHLDMVGYPKGGLGKPFANPPAYWYWSEMEKWLTTPVQDGSVILQNLGHSGPIREYRTHVSIENASQTAREGVLFQTSGLEFLYTGKPTEPTELRSLTNRQRLALAVETDAGLNSDISFLGGERRVVTWRPSTQTMPTCPRAIRDEIKRSKHCRLLLATPGCFAAGFAPSSLKSQISGIDVTLAAASVPRYQTVSGWDYAANPRRPKPTRRLAPAGSVYFLRLQGTDSAIDDFIDAFWLGNISDDESSGQSSRDGFGLSLLGVWNGDLAKMEIEQ